MQIKIDEHGKPLPGPELKRQTPEPKTEMRKLVFGEGLMVPSLMDDKYFTIRKFRESVHDFKKGEIVIGVFKEGFNFLLRITADSKIAPFKKLKSSKRSTEKNGYQFDDKYFEDLEKNFYPGLTWDDMGAVVFQEILKIDGVPIASINEYMMKE